MRKLLVQLTTCLLCIPWAASLVYGENLYESATGSLILPVIDVGDGTTYSGFFSLVSSEPLIWAGTSFELVNHSSRTAASYDPVTTSLWVPEINVEGNLYSLRFALTDNCEADVCIEPLVDSVIDDGREGANIFMTPLTSASTFSCASCHAMSENDGFAGDGFRRPGHPLLNAAKRASYKNGALDSMLDAVNICVTEWMNGEPLASNDPNWINLMNWLQDQNTIETTDPVVIDIVPPPQDLSGGDTTNGRELFNSRCIVCHGFDGEGTQLAPRVAERGLLPELIARRVRTSGRSDSAAYEGLSGGVMPFWGANRLTNGELIDIVAFVADGNVTDIDLGQDQGGSGNPGCTANSPKVGQTAMINGRFHNVTGTATIIDDCTIEITGFSFDGGGIAVHIYLGLGGDFRDQSGGFAISENLVGTAFSNNTLRLTLPAGRSLNEFDSISVWCIPVGISFGTGFFS